MADENEEQEHFDLVWAGLALHESFQYAEALKVFQRAKKLAPKCPIVLYNVANTSHMLGRDKAAYRLLQDLRALSEDDLRRGCPDSDQTPRSLLLDVHFLLFHVTLHLKGSCEEAFDYADEHLRQRRRGVRSAWTKRQVLGDVAEARREWEDG